MTNDNDTYAVRSHDVRLDGNYAEWLRDIKSRYRRSQIKAAVKVNSEKLLFNWQLGRDLVMRKAEERWGSGIVEQVSLDLQREFPGEGFSTTNIWYMKKWYLFYSEKLNQVGSELGEQKLKQLASEFDRKKLVQLGQEVEDTKLEQSVQEMDGEKLHQAGGEFLQQAAEETNQTKLQQPIGEIHSVDIQEDTILQQPIGEFQEEITFPVVFGFVPWGHHIDIITKCKDLDEALHYIRRTIDGNWSRNYLLERIKNNDYQNRDKHAVNNFPDYLPLPQAQLAEELTKESYDFGFIALPSLYKEKQLEDALCEQLTQFLLELGTGFAFIGRQKEIVVAGKTRRIDLLFYHIRLRCYIVCDLKARPFEPEYAGKINFYVNAVDDLFKTEDDNPTIGLLICSDMNHTEVQYAFRGINTPLGVAAYKNIQEIQRFLPTVEQLKERIRMLEDELRRPKSPPMSPPCTEAT